VRSYFIGAPYTGTSQGRAYQASILSETGKGEVGYDPMKPARSARRILGEEYGFYSTVGPKNRRGRYYYSASQILGRNKFVYTGPTIGSKGRADFVPRSPGSNIPGGYVAARRSRLNIDPEELAKINEEAAATPVRYRLGARRYLN